MLASRRCHFQPVFLTTCLMAGLASTNAALAEEDSILDLTVGGGVGYEPDYEGSDDYELGLFPYAELSLYDGLVNLSIGGLQGFLPLGDRAFIGVGVSYDGGRDEDENDDLDGLGDIDDTVIGSISGGLLLGPAVVALTFNQDLDSGHEGYTIDLIAETGVEIIEDKAEVTLGVGTTWASENYTEAFFGVSAAQAAASGLDQFDADEGFKSAGVEIGASYALTESLSLGIESSYVRLLGDAADSPLVEDRGSPNQFSAGVFLTFELGLL